MKHNIRKHRIWIVSGILATVVLCLSLISQSGTPNQYHTQEELEAFERGDRAPIDSGEYFLGAVRCEGCHGFDSLGEASVDADGNTVNVFDDWQTSMMALSAIDPLWRAKVSHESLVNPAHADELQNTCTKCHSPMGHYSAIFKGAPHYTFSDLLNDTLGLDGVSCQACHTIKPNSPTAYSGDIEYDTTRKEYGPFQAPMIGPMQLYIGFDPTYSIHMDFSQICAPCHTLYTHTADLNGNSTGGTFVEQATYHEWLNSKYPDQEEYCQRCHMPQLDVPVIIANEQAGLQPRWPFNKHHFTGANYYMVNLIRQFKAQLGREHVPDYKFDSTLNRTLEMLRTKSVMLTAGLDSVRNGTAYFQVNLLNKAGHKFPSGYPSRRAFVQFVVTGDNGDTLFASGLWDSNYELQGMNPAFEPHYETITTQDQIQVYEMVMADVNGSKTTVLERAADMLKDNRIPPQGFSTTHDVYDTVQIVGNAATDPNFNKTGATEGSGRDVVFYNIPLNGYTGPITVSARLFYQTLPPGWLTEMFAFNSPQIDSFRNMYLASERTPILVQEQIFTENIVSANEAGEHAVKVFPNPAHDLLFIHAPAGTRIEEIKLFSAEGKLAATPNISKLPTGVAVSVKGMTGIYFVQFNANGRRMVKRVVLH